MSPERYRLPFLLLRNVTPPTLACFGVDRAVLGSSAESLDRCGTQIAPLFHVLEILMSLLPPSATRNRIWSTSTS